MNEDQLTGAAEREMGLYRDEITRLQTDIASLTDQRNRVSDTADQLRELLDATKLVLQETSRESSQRGEQLDTAVAARDEYRDNAVLHIGERDEARAELDKLRLRLAARDDLLARMLGKFTLGSDGYHARISQVAYIRLRLDAGREITDKERKMIGA